MFGKKKKIFASCRRRFVREPVMLAGSAMSVTRSRSVIISNLSAEGAGLGGRDLPSPGDDLLMKAGSVDRMGRVIWRIGDRCGVRLDQPLRHESIDQMKQEASWDAVTGWA